jgi:SHS2 domain-containing protein
VTYRFVEHTADLAVAIEAATLEDLFSDAAAAFTACLVGGARVEPVEERTVALRAPDLDRLLVRWLQEALAAFDIDGFLVSRAAPSIVRGAGACELRGVLFGERIDAGRHPVEVLIKGVSYHGLHVEQAGARWRATVVFDI